MAKFAQGFYQVQNQHKYVGISKPRFRSSWELVFCRFCDNNPHIIQWASESITIPYRNPLTGKQTVYVPDFFVVYQTRHDKVVAELVEIKPRKQSLLEGRQTPRERAAVVVNYAKWEAATKWCRQQGITFRVINEDDLFVNGQK